MCHYVRRLCGLAGRKKKGIGVDWCVIVVGYELSVEEYQIIVVVYIISGYDCGEDIAIFAIGSH